MQSGEYRLYLFAGSWIDGSMIAIFGGKNAAADHFRYILFSKGNVCLFGDAGEDDRCECSRKWRLRVFRVPNM